MLVGLYLGTLLHLSRSLFRTWRLSPNLPELSRWTQNWFEIQAADRRGRAWLVVINELESLWIWLHDTIRHTWSHHTTFHLTLWLTIINPSTHFTVPTFWRLRHLQLLFWVTWLRYYAFAFTRTLCDSRSFLVCIINSQFSHFILLC